MLTSQAAHALPPAVQVSPPGQQCQANVLPGNDDGSTGLVPIGFSGAINFFGTNYNQLYVNNNGNVTFDGPLGTFTPFGLVGAATKIIAVYFGDWDTRGANPGGVDDDVRYGNTTFNGRPAFCVDYTGVDYNGIGYYSVHKDKLNSHQLVLVERFDTGPGNFDICFNWNKTQWETGDASGGSGGLGGASARVGWSNGSNNSYEEPGSGVNGAFLDSNPNGLAYRTNTTPPLPGRKCFDVREGVPQATPGKISARGTVQTTQGPKIGFSAANDCNEALSTRPSIIETTTGARIWTKNNVTESDCSDTPPPSPPLNFDRQIGEAQGTFGPAAPGGLNGQPGTLEWNYYNGTPDGAPDTVSFQLSNGGVVYTATTQPPGPHRGSPGGVWTFGP